jgi:hypothetical protein
MSLIPTIRRQVRSAASMRRENLGAPVVADTDRIVVAVDIADGAQVIAAQPDVPRNLTATLADANDSVTAATLTIQGITPQGETVTETVTLAQLKAGWTGAKIYAVVSSVTVAGVAGTVDADTDQLVVGVGNVIGLAAPIQEPAAVKHVFLGGARVASPTIAIGDSTSGVDVSGSTYDGSKELVVFYNPMEG